MIPTRAGVIVSGAAGGLQAVGGSMDLAATTPNPINFTTPLAGDIAFISAFSNSGGASISGGVGGWFSNSGSGGFGWVYTTFWKALAAGDLAGVSVVGAAAGPIAISTYRGASVVTLKSTTGVTTATTPTALGFTKNGACKGVVSSIVRANAAELVTPPGTFVSRAGPGGVANARCGIADITNPANYVNGTAVGWTTPGTGNEEQVWLFELT